MSLAGYCVVQMVKPGLEFQVRDPGIGLTTEQVDGLFEAFTQVDTPTTRKYGGTGLGLAISKRLVELMGGRIWVESTLGIGSCFGFTARFGHGEAAQARALMQANASEVAAARARLQGVRILVVEDDAFNQQIIEALLQQSGAWAQVCENGHKALAYLEQAQFDWVLLDVQMPVTDGYEATRQIRANPALAGQRVIAMTGNAMASARERCFAAGMDDFETKPIDPDHLYLTLAKWLPAPQKLPGPTDTAIAEVSPEIPQSAPFDFTVLGRLFQQDPAKVGHLAREFLHAAPAAMTAFEAA